MRQLVLWMQIQKFFEMVVPDFVDFVCFCRGCTQLNDFENSLNQRAISSTKFKISINFKEILSNQLNIVSELLRNEKRTFATSDIISEFE